MQLLILQMLCYWPVWRWYISRLVDGSDEPWGIFALSAFILCQIIIYRPASLEVTPERLDSEIKDRRLLLPIIFTAIYLVIFLNFTPLIRALFAILSLGSLWLCDSKETLSRYGLLLLSLPIISSLEFYLGYPLRLALTFTVAKFLQLVAGLPVKAEGTILNFSGTLVVVDAPCSGLKMLWAGIFITLLLASLFRLRNSETLCSIWFSLRIILAANLLRTILLFYKESGLVPLPAWTHVGIGIVTFGMAVILITRRMIGIRVND